MPKLQNSQFGVDYAIRNRKKDIREFERRQRRELVKQLSQEYLKSVVCQVLEVPRSSVYYQAVAPKSEDGVKREIARLAAEHPSYGYRRITAMLHREGQVVQSIVISRKRIERLANF